jgi:hypothetical protein
LFRGGCIFHAFRPLKNGVPIDSDPI